MAALRVLVLDKLGSREEAAAARAALRDVVAEHGYLSRDAQLLAKEVAAKP